MFEARLLISSALHGKRALPSWLVLFSDEEAVFKWEELMRILLYNPDNGVTRNFMPHLWMFLLQALTPRGHEVVLIDGNAQPMDEESIARYVREQNVGLNPDAGPILPRTSFCA